MPRTQSPSKAFSVAIDSGGSKLSSELIRLIQSRKAAHWGGVILGIFLGVVLLTLAPGAFFSAVMQTPLDVITFPVGILAAVSVLPLAVVAIFRPRLAARGIGLSWLTFLIASLPSVSWGAVAPMTSLDLVRFTFWFFALPGGIVALLLRSAPKDASPATALVKGAASGPPTEAPRTRAGAEPAVNPGGALELPSRKRMAKWVAIFLGVALGLWRFQWAWHSAVHAPQIIFWMTACNATAWLAAAPYALLGIWKPRWAAYAFVACFLALVASPVLTTFNFGDVFGYLPFTGLQALPFALVAALFFYAGGADVEL